MYRYRLLAPLKNRPLEAAAGLIAILRGVWAVIWPANAHDHSVLLAVGTLMPPRFFGVLVLLTGIWQFRMAYVTAPEHWQRILPVYLQVVMIGVILQGYLRYDHSNVATAFYLGMWWTQVWIWGDLYYARKQSRA